MDRVFQHHARSSNKLIDQDHVSVGQTQQPLSSFLLMHILSHILHVTHHHLITVILTKSLAIMIPSSTGLEQSMVYLNETFFPFAVPPFFFAGLPFGLLEGLLFFVFVGDCAFQDIIEEKMSE